jgi:hypothetical protein
MKKCSRDGQPAETSTESLDALHAGLGAARGRSL